MICFLAVKREREKIAGLLFQGQSRAFLAITHLVPGDLIRLKQIKERFFTAYLLLVRGNWVY